MPFAVTALGRAAIAAAQKGNTRTSAASVEDETPVDENGQRISPLQAAQRDIAEEKASDGDAPSTVKGAGLLAEALAAHAAAHRTTPQPLATLQTSAAATPAGPTFAPGTATVEVQNHRGPNSAFPQVHAPGQPAFHAASLSPGSHR